MAWDFAVGDGQHRGQAMMLAPGAAAIGQGPQALVQVLQLGGAQGDALHGCASGGGKRRGAQ